MQELQYLNLLRELVENGVPKPDRTGVGTFSLFGRQIRFDLSEEFPLLTTKKIHFRSVAHELLWFLSGDSNVRYLNKNGVRIWDEWADPATGDLGPIYGTQWRSWPGPDGEAIDQLARVVEEIRTDPHSRRLVVSAWNVSDLPKMALPPCHVLFQFYVVEGKLSLALYQRSADIFLGVPFNIASYSLLLLMVAHVTDLEPGEFVHTFGDVHLYRNHLEQAREQLARENYLQPFPRLEIVTRRTDLFSFDYNDFRLVRIQKDHPIQERFPVFTDEKYKHEGYKHHPAIPAPVAV